MSVSPKTGDKQGRYEIFMLSQWLFMAKWVT
jgi:hypothetical protein